VMVWRLSLPDNSSDEGSDRRVGTDQIQLQRKGLPSRGVAGPQVPHVTGGSQPRIFYLTCVLGHTHPYVVGRDAESSDKRVSTRSPKHPAALATVAKSMVQTKDAGATSSLPATAPIEVVNDRYWLKRGTQMIDAGISRREEAASKLVTGVGWFWTIYTTVAITGVAFADRAFGYGASALIALPILLLIVAYLLGLRVMMPISGDFHPEEPVSVRDAYVRGVNEKKLRLSQAQWVTVAAAFAVIAAAIATALTPPTSSDEVTFEGNRTSEATAILVEGRVDADESVAFIVEATEVIDGELPPPVRELSQADSDGQIEEVLEIPDAVMEADVTARWEDIDGVIKVLTESIVLPD